jgi:hypothetical protein
MKISDGKFEPTCGRQRFVGEPTKRYADALCEKCTDDE